MKSTFVRFAAMGFFSMCCSFSAAFASEMKNDTTITFDFPSRQIKFFGIYSPASQTSQRARGLDAEMAARRNGITHLMSYFANSCKGSTSENGGSTNATPSWQGAVKSLGSEIYSNGVLKISLIVPLQSVLGTEAVKKPMKLKSKDGAPLALKLPRLPGSVLKCGVLNVSLAGKTIPINPLSGSADSGAKPVTFSFDGVSAVKPASSTDLALLEGSNLLNGGSNSSDDSSQQATRSDAGDNANQTQNSAPASSQPVNQ